MPPTSPPPLPITVNIAASFIEKGKDSVTQPPPQKIKIESEPQPQPQPPPQNNQTQNQPLSLIRGNNKEKGGNSRPLSRPSSSHTIKLPSVNPLPLD